MTQKEKEIRALKTYVEIGVCTINEAREKLGESPIANPEADQLLVRREGGWMHFSNAPAIGWMEALFPKAFSSIRDGD